MQISYLMLNFDAFYHWVLWQQVVIVNASGLYWCVCCRDAAGWWIWSAVIAHPHPAELVAPRCNSSVLVYADLCIPALLCAVIMSPPLQIHHQTLKLMHCLYYSTEGMMLPARMNESAVIHFVQQLLLKNKHLNSHRIQTCFVLPSS